MTTLTNTTDAPPDRLLQELLAESRELTAVERFAKAHDAGDVPAQAKHYQGLIPVSVPAAGEQYAFDVDLDQCSGCKACVSACHSLNGLEPTETWRSVGQLHGQGKLPILQHVTTACHHCVEPGCLSGCPTNAYEKDPETGIVRHLDDQCFGCQYCTMACPYEVPQYSPSKGIVRKCDMCQGRLAAGEAPACVQACPNQAIRITVVDVAETVTRTTAGHFLPDSPSTQLTHPTTVYRSERGVPADLLGADAHYAAPQHAHLPLVVMLVLTQLSVGGLAIGAFSRWVGMGIGAEVTIVLATLAGLAGLGVAPLHLGRPHLAFRSILGWRHSWLSREAIVFGVYAPMAILASVYVLLPFIVSWFPQAESLLTLALPELLRPVAELGAVILGAVGIFCSGKIYEFTGREFWLGLRTRLKFGGTPIVLGLSLVLTATQLASAATPSRFLTGLLILASLVKLVYEASVFMRQGEPAGSLPQTARLMKQNLAKVTLTRFACGAAGGVLLPLLLAGSATPWLAASISVLAFACLLAGELAERALYFSAVIPLRMPGGVKS